MLIEQCYGPLSGFQCPKIVSRFQYLTTLFDLDLMINQSRGTNGSFWTPWFAINNCAAFKSNISLDNKIDKTFYIVQFPKWKIGILFV